MNTEILAAGLPQGRPVASALRSIDELPGPPGLPWVGNILQVSLPRIHRDVEAWARRYGSLFRFRLGPMRILAVADHELITGLLRDRPQRFRRAQRMTDTAHEMGIKLGVFNAEGEDWQQQRRMVMAAFSAGHVRAYFPSLLRVTQRLRARWQTAAREGADIDLLRDLMRYTVDGVAGLAFGREMNTLQAGDDVIQRHLDKILPVLFARINAVVPYWRVFKLPVDRQLDRSVAALDEAIRGFIAEARGRLHADPARREHPHDLLEAMLAAADQEGGMSDAAVAGNVFTMLLAGEDTTASTLAWLIYLLKSHPEAWQRARSEVNEAVGSVEELDMQQVDRLAFLDACVHETMRLKPVAPFNPIEAVHDTVIADVQVPAGTIVWCVMRHDSVDERLVPGGTAFQPERWLDPARSGGPEGAPNVKRISMPFGAGPRICPGRYLAILEIKMAMVMLLKHFDLAHVGTPDGAEPHELMSFTMSPQGLRMRLRERP